MCVERVHGEKRCTWFVDERRFVVPFLVSLAINRHRGNFFFVLTEADCMCCERTCHWTSHGLSLVLHRHNVHVQVNVSGVNQVSPIGGKNLSNGWTRTLTGTEANGFQGKLGNCSVNLEKTRIVHGAAQNERTLVHIMLFLWKIVWCSTNASAPQYTCCAV